MRRTERLTDQLRTAIARGAYRPDRPLPSERELCDVHRVSRTTVRRALQLLVDEGLLYRRASLGTFVAALPAEATPNTQQATIGLIVPTLANPYFGELTTAIEQACRAASYQLMLGQSDLTAHSLEHYLAHYAQNAAVRGVIAVSTVEALPPATYDQLRAVHKPLLFVVRHDAAIGADAVATDHIEGAKAILRHLLAHGHRRIAYIGEAHAQAARHFQGYCALHGEAGLPLDPALQVFAEAPTLDEVGVRGVEQLRAQGVAFSAIFAQVDAIAVGVLRALRAAGTRVPEDVSLVSFDNIPAAAYLDPPLTTVDHTVREIGRLAIQLLDDRVTGRYDGPPRRVLIEPRVIVRGSSGPAPITTAGRF